MLLFSDDQLRACAYLTCVKRYGIEHIIEHLDEWSVCHWDEVL